MTTLTGSRLIDGESYPESARTMTAYQMTMTSHDLSRDGFRALTEDGRLWVWDERRCLWVA